MRDLTTPQWNEGNDVKGLPIYAYLIEGDGPQTMSSAQNGYNGHYWGIFYSSNPSLTKDDLLNKDIYLNGCRYDGGVPYKINITSWGSGGHTLGGGVFYYYIKDTSSPLSYKSITLAGNMAAPTLTRLGGGLSKRRSSLSRKSKKEGSVRYA